MFIKKLPTLSEAELAEAKLIYDSDFTNITDTVLLPEDGVIVKPPPEKKKGGRKRKAENVNSEKKKKNLAVTSTMPNIRGFCCDDETGEVIYYRVNEETGEPSVEDNVPPVYLTTTQTHKTAEPKKYMKFPKGYMAKTKKFQSLKANIIAGSNPISFRMLLIPTVTIFPGFLCILLMVLEIFLHINCHKKNKRLKDPNLFYRSPFHVVTSTFCASCRESQSSSKVGQLQDKRRYRYDYLRSIAL